MKIKTSYGEENDINLKLVIALSRTHLSFGRGLQIFLNEYGLTLAQFGVLEALYHLGEMRICELIDKTLSTSGNMTVVIRNLEKEGLIERKTNPDDKRAFNIALTAKGEDKIKVAFESHLVLIDRFFSNLDGEEKLALQKLLKKVNGL
ncbi:MAG: MarR family transcriptional regulator [Clostridia bacterium]|nr:MarR family transcriptional regulator [Clostridia bacterium]